MCDRDQEIFNHAETLGDQLQNLEGCVAALYDLLDAPLAASNDKGIKVYAILAAVEHFRASAQAETRLVALMASGVSA